MFNSPLHFIGFGQGTVVNTEIVQRLGTLFLYAGEPTRLETDGTLFPETHAQGLPHQRVLDWYAGTANVSLGQNETLDQFGLIDPNTNLYRRLGDLNLVELDVGSRTWYTPDHTGGTFEHGDREAPWEGMGTGWFNAAIGGSLERRPYLPTGATSASDKVTR